MTDGDPLEERPPIIVYRRDVARLGNWAVKHGLGDSAIALRKLLELGERIDAVSFQTTDRGFAHFEPIETDHGHTVSIYESSAAEQPYIWIATELKEATLGGLEPESTHAHCTIEQCVRIRDTLDAVIANHYQLED